MLRVFGSCEKCCRIMMLGGGQKFLGGALSSAASQDAGEW